MNFPNPKENFDVLRFFVEGEEDGLPFTQYSIGIPAISMIKEVFKEMGNIHSFVLHRISLFLKISKTEKTDEQIRRRIKTH